MTWATRDRAEAAEARVKELEAAAWVAKYAVTFYHGCDRHGGEWTDCDKGPCGEARRLGLIPTLIAAKASKR